MASLNLAAPWHIVKEKMKEINTDLTDEDLEYTAGEEEALLTRLQKKIKGSKENIRGIIESVSGNEGKAG